MSWWNPDWEPVKSRKGRPPKDLLIINDICIRAKTIQNYRPRFRIGYVYAIKCPITKHIVYIGKTQDYRSRKCSHFCLTGKTLVNRWYAAMMSIGYKPIFEVIDYTYGDILWLEYQYIYYYSNIGQANFNIKHTDNHINKRKIA